MPAVHRVLALLSGSGLLLSALVHLAAVLGHDLTDRLPGLWSLHVGMFVVFVPFVISVQARRPEGEAGRRGAWRPWTSLPRPWKVVGAALMVYVPLNFAWCTLNSPAGQVMERGGALVLEYKGRVVRTVTREEADEARAHLARGFSGHWMLFYFAPFAWFAFVAGRCPVPTPPTSTPPHP